MTTKKMTKAQMTATILRHCDVKNERTVDTAFKVANRRTLESVKKIYDAFEKDKENVGFYAYLLTGIMLSAKK